VREEEVEELKERRKSKDNGEAHRFAEKKDGNTEATEIRTQRAQK